MPLKYTILLCIFSISTAVQVIQVAVIAVKVHVAQKSYQSLITNYSTCNPSTGQDMQVHTLTAQTPHPTLGF